MDKIYYMGSFPPPYGGVTLKNELLHGLLKDKVDICIKQKFTALSTIEVLLKGKRFILGVGHTKFLLMVTTVMYYFRRKAMSRSIVFLMGGNLADLVDEKPIMLKRLQHYRHIYVEPTGMMARLKKMGLNNISLLPNCRIRPKTEYLPQKNMGSLRCIFFSRVMVEKGIENILNAAALLPNVEIDIYGPIEVGYEDTFYEKMNLIQNVTYQGLFKERNDSLYKLLHDYDVMLLPSKCASEGVPGALVEAKISALPAIVSDISYNSEIVEDGVSGIVLKENTAEELAKAIDRLDADREELYRLKCGAKQSAEMYYIEGYIEDILKKLEE